MKGERNMLEQTRNWLLLHYLKWKWDERGEINIIAMVLIIIVVIALVAIFRNEMTDIVTKMFEKIREQMEV
jgi:hypothetical protein